MNTYVISTLETQWRKEPTSRVFFRLAEEYRRGGVYDKAIEVCSAGLGHHPTYLPARVCIGRCRQKLGDLEQAEQDFEQVLKVAPDNPHALRGLASICYNNARYGQALEHYETLAIHDPSDEAVAERIVEIKQIQSEQDTQDLAEEHSPEDMNAANPFEEVDNPFEEEPNPFEEEPNPFEEEANPLDQQPMKADEINTLDLQVQQAMGHEKEPQPLADEQQGEDRKGKKVRLLTDWLGKIEAEKHVR